VFPLTRRLVDRSNDWLDAGTMIRRLRAMVPDRRLTSIEAYRLAERQAFMLLAVAGIDTAPVDCDLISGLSAVDVRRVSGMPVGGASFWTGSSWVIVIDTDQSNADQRVTLFHEFKHILDYRSSGRSFFDDNVTEPAADYFARCVLMPRPWVKRAIGNGARTRSALAERFGVSIDVVDVRLVELGLADQVGRPRGINWRSRSRRRRRGCQR
jgi:IrrE N-terminal-like domain